MKKMFKPLSAIFMSAAIAASAGAMTAMPALAADDEYSITITKSTNDKADHVYMAYQIFTGTLGTDNTTLSSIEWGDGVNSDDLLVALKASDKFGTTNPFETCDSAAAVSNVLNNYNTGSEEAIAFANIVKEHVKAEKGVNIANNKVKGAGYYIVVDTIPNIPDSHHQYAYSDHILKVVTNRNITETAKTDVPFITKNIIEGTELKSANAVSIGDTVPFVLQSKVPDMSNYNDYYYIINDTMSKGLSFNNDVVIKVGTYTLTPNTEYRVTVTANETTGGQDIEIKFLDFYEKLYKEAVHTGEDIRVEYSATLNSKADLTSAGNPNTVDLTFSNDPNHEYKGGDEPTGDETNVVGKTPKSTTKTFTTGIKLYKKDSITGEKLSGAKFKIEGNGVKAVMINGQIFKEDAEGTYYLLKDGTFTEDGSQADDKYDSKTKKYKLINSVTKDTATSTDPVNQIGISDGDGYITFVGLGAGTYQITEIEAPDRYHKLDEVINIIITATINDTQQTCTWNATKGGNELSNNNTDNLFKFEVENNKGMTLPGTGGIGTTIFYIVGALLVSGALVLLITKKRMNIKEK